MPAIPYPNWFIDCCIFSKPAFIVSTIFATPASSELLFSRADEDEDFTILPDFVRHFHERRVFFIPVFTRAFVNCCALGRLPSVWQQFSKQGLIRSYLRQVRSSRSRVLLLIGKTSARSLVPLWSSTFYERENQHTKSGERA